MLIISTIKEVPIGRMQSIIRSVYMMPGLICAGILTKSGINIQLTTFSQNEIVKNLNDSSTWSDTATNVTNIVLQNPIWITVHLMIFIVILIYIITQVVNLLTKKE